MTDAVGWRGVYAPVCAALGDSSCFIGLARLPAAEKRAADTRQPGLNPVYAGPDAVYCIAYGHSRPAVFIPDHAGLAHHRVGAVRGVCRTLPEGEQPGAGTLPAASSAFLSAYCCCLSPPAVATWSCRLLFHCILWAGEGMSESQSALYLMALTAPMLVFHPLRPCSLAGFHRGRCPRRD